MLVGVAQLCRICRPTIAIYSWCLSRTLDARGGTINSLDSEKVPAPESTVDSLERLQNRRIKLLEAAAQCNGPIEQQLLNESCDVYFDYLRRARTLVTYYIGKFRRLRYQFGSKRSVRSGHFSAPLGSRRDRRFGRSPPPRLQG